MPDSLMNVSITPAETTTATIAASAVVSPGWLPWLQSTSEVAAMVAPILGALWLVIQIYAKVRELRRTRKNEDKQ